MLMVIKVGTDYGSGAELRCDCGMWNSRGNTDIEIMAKAMNHIKEEHRGEGVIEFDPKFIVVTDSSVTVLER